MAVHRSQKIRRQAVVIIHGMGEQRPMQTLRSFVTGITNWIKHFEPEKHQQPRYWSRPEGISDIYETRRITMEQHDGNPKTDFYEFYWAHHMRKTSFDHLVPWVWKLLSAKTSTIPPRLKRLWWAIWIIIIASLAVLVAAYFYAGNIKTFFKNNWGITLGVSIFAGLVLKILSWLIKVPFGSLILNTAGDAARYFNPMPSNIEERSTIRREGIAFLKKLHTKKDRPYDRIILVGHSLGSVVAYDMLRLLWQEMHEEFEPSQDVDHDIFEKMNAVAAGKTPIEDVSTFQQLQHDCWKQYRQNGNPWLITDFITCAGAIAHADFYLLNNIPFKTLVNQKEFPVCPPVLEGSDTNLFFNTRTNTVGTDDQGKPILRTVHCLNHSAPFAITRWTNIFFSSDYVGSDAQRIFGKGIKDIAVPRKGWMLIPGGHTNYWDALPGNEALRHIAKAIGLKQLTTPEQPKAKN